MFTVVNWKTGLSEAACNGINVMWRPCSFTPIYSLTGPVGQLFASRLGGQRPRIGDAPTLTMELGSLLAMTRYIGDGTWFDH
jgi:hypothetical protein